MTKTTTTYALPPEPEGPVWDRNGDKWERTGEMLHVHGREWAEWRHVASGDVGTWPAPLMRGPVTNTEPTPAWPTAPLVWWDGKVWVRAATETYFGDSSFWGKHHLNSETASIREAARRFAREAIPVTPVPTEAWETWKYATRYLDYTPDSELIDAVDSLAQEVAR